MSKQPPRAKRKTSSYADDDDDQKIAAADNNCMNQLLANLDLSDTKTTPKVVAKALLSLLPADATKQHSSSKKLVSFYMYQWCIVIVRCGTPKIDEHTKAYIHVMCCYNILDARDCLTVEPKYSL